jgi:hypothetical protein
MRCLEIAVNGERYCVAGADHVPMLSAAVTHDRPEDPTERDKTSLTVHGLSGDFATDYHWGERLTLAAGDVVTTRVIEASAPDAPIPFPTPPAVVRARERQRDLNQKRTAMRESTSHFDLSSLLEERRRTLFRSLLFWATLLVFGALICLWFFGS